MPAGNSRTPHTPHREIDRLVYQLYGLTPEEIALVEGAGNPAPARAAD